ncbi:MAG: amidase [Terriglobia bacterium]
MTSIESKRTRLLNRRGFIGAAVVGSAAAVMPARPRPADTAPGSASFDLEEISVTELQEGFKRGRYTAHSITEMYLRRIGALDRRGPAVNSVIEINPDALSIAAALDRERKVSGPRGPLHGIPVLIKDNIGTHDRMMTTAGSLALAGSIPAEDSFLARKLREAGAVILGKTNLSEWANFRSSHSTSGWSGRGGLTRNPYALDRNPCGSSSGSGAGVSANFCALGVGTETDGSVVCPSSINGLVGIKPTVGLISRRGIIPISHSQDTAGPMARTVADAAVLLSALAGVDLEDRATLGSRGNAQSDYTKFLDPHGLRGSHIGVVRKFFGFNEAVDRLVNAALDEMKQQGATLIDPVEIASLKRLDGSEGQVLLYEFKADLNKYLAGLGPAAPVHSLADIIQFNERNREREMPYFGQDLFVQAQAKGPLTSKEYLAARANEIRCARTEGIDAVMEKHKLDALLAPTAGPAWMTDLVNGDHDSSSSSTPAAIAGYPSITVPAGFVFGLPVGISFFGRGYAEPTLIKLASGFEQATHARRPPRFLATANLSV